MRWIRLPPTATDARCAALEPDVRPALGPRGKTWFACSWAPFSQELEPPLNPGRFIAGSETQITLLNQVLKVSDFAKDPALRKRVLLECHDNPGQLRNDPNCINAEKAAVSALLSDKPPRF
ncbi:EexN family lipoprotein [Cupriavidus plantarum]|uniref:EexN family lipoprotein n=1 Tax=Cupriavidus plantarum TaxID=942865 RepID=UPI00339D8F19